MVLIHRIRAVSLAAAAALFLVPAPAPWTASACAHPPFTDEERLELRAFASWFWLSRGYTDVPVLEWGAPLSGECTWELANQDGFNPFLESLQVFDAVYSAQISAARACGEQYYAITDLLHDEAQVFAAFRWHTCTGELVTVFADEPEVALKHAEITIFSDSDAPHFEFDECGLTESGVVWSIGLRVTAPPPVDCKGILLPQEDSPPISVLPQVVDDRLREALEVWANCFLRFGGKTFPDGGVLPRLFRRDGYGLRLQVVPDMSDTYPILMWPVPVLTPGFDCDDFADAFICWFRQRFTTQELEGMEFFIYQVGDGSWGHTMVVVRVGQVYWVVDPATGEVRGPIAVPTDGSSWPDPNLIVTDPPDGPPGSRGYGRTRDSPYHGFPRFYPAGSRPFYEPTPWYTNPTMRQWFDGYLEALRQLRQANGEDTFCLEGVDWRKFAPEVP